MLGPELPIRHSPSLLLGVNVHGVLRTVASTNRVQPFVMAGGRAPNSGHAAPMQQ